MIEILNFKKIDKNTLKGSCEIRLPKCGGMIIGDICYFQDGNKDWVTMPSKQYESEGKRKYWPYIRFEDKDTNERFKRSICDAIREYLSKNVQQVNVEHNLPF